MEHVLACNAGSSSLKLSLFAGSPAQGWVLINTVNLPAPAASDHAEASAAPSYSDMLSSWLQPLPQPQQILHRVVHAGAVPERAVALSEDVLAQIRHWLPLAPRHNALTLELITTLKQRWPQQPQFAIYDSGLYADLPAHAARYALPDNLSPAWPLRRYGFHGLAHRNQWRQVQQIQEAPSVAEADSVAQRDRTRGSTRMISVHLGSGASVTAWQNGVAVDTSMGFSPLEGLLMARRSGSIDPGILMHLLLREQMSPQALDALLHERSGLSALAGNDGDLQLIMQEFAQSGSKRAGAAIDQYCYQIRKTIGSYMAALGGIDTISFSGGVAEHQPLIRQQIVQGLEGLGIVVDSQANAALNQQRLLQAGVFHSPQSTCALYLIPVNEMDEMLRQYEAFVLTA